MTKKEIIVNKLNDEGFKLGCWHDMMEKLTKKDLNKVLEVMTDAIDTDVMIRGKLHVVEIDEVEGEIDFSVLPQAEYIDRYGDERWDN